MLTVITGFIEVLKDPQRRKFFGRSGIKMFIRAAAILTVLALAGGPAAAGPFEARDCEHRSPTTTQSFAGERSVTALEPRQLARPVRTPAPDPRAELTNGRSVGTHADLLQFAIYASVGNRDGMAILSNRLRKFGVTREQLQDFVDHTKLHDGLLPPQDRPADVD